MRRAIAMVTFVLLVGAFAAQAHGPEKPGAGFTRDLVNDFERVGKKLIALAEATSPDHFSWRPVDEVRTVSEVYMHVVGTNMLLPPAMGAEPPHGMAIPKNPIEKMQELESTYTTKDDVVRMLRESFKYAGPALRAIPGETLDEELDLFGFPASRRTYMLIVLTHAHEHLGQSIAYARTLGIVPPWSQAGGGDDGGGDHGDDDHGHDDHDHGDGDSDDHGDGESGDHGDG